ncbi:MAG: hydrogenase expression/formation protein HypE [Deltaproteobacteria bacterium]|nr:hydrogenase expression/formation protein HypE [Deltaproteobacteria bacterium]
MKERKILLEHGSGGRLSHELIQEIFLPLLRNEYLEKLEDGAVFTGGGGRYCFTTDSFVVSPVFFPGGDIGSLAVHGTVNDLAVMGARPLYLSAGFILEEGFPFDALTTIVCSMADAASRAGVTVVAGDTKVVPRGAADGIFITTSGIGVIEYRRNLSAGSVRPGDAVIVNGTMGDHGAAILVVREGLRAAALVSDSAPLNELVACILAASPNVHCMRDITRGGLTGILKEIALSARMDMMIEEAVIPVAPEVRGVCEMLGLDVLTIANEGKLAVFCAMEDAAQVLTAIKDHPLGRNATMIGRVEAKGTGRVILKTHFGGLREVDLPSGELVPRIC